ncbi:MAG: hypothetical protein ABI654_11530, partial [Betaproteobacteria bacterium]
MLLPESIDRFIMRFEKRAEMTKISAWAIFLTASLLGASVGTFPSAAAQEFPNRPVRIVVPYP